MLHFGTDMLQACYHDTRGLSHYFHWSSIRSPRSGLLEPLPMIWGRRTPTPRLALRVSRSLSDLFSEDGTMLVIIDKATVPLSS